MIKKIILGSIFLFSLQTIAQESTASPYSFNGIGEFKFNGTVDNRAMGGIGILSDSIHLNLQNPASLSSLKLTTFAMAGTFSPTKFKSEAKTEKAQRTSLDYLAMAFPAGKVVFSLGLMPYSAVGYKIINIGETESYKYDGSGGVNKFFAGAGYQITPKLSLGAEIGYNFGKIERSAVYAANGIQFGTREINATELGGMTFNTGVNYKTKISKLDFITSLAFSPSTSLKTNTLRTTETVSFTSNGNVIGFDPKDEKLPGDELRMPSKLAFGSGLGVDKKWFVGFESTFSSKGDLDIDPDDNITCQSATKFALGGYYIPKYNSFSNYFDKITYRAGLRYENTGLVVESQQIKDQALTLGFGLPLSGTFSNINLGVEFGKKGTKSAGLFQENYMNFSVGLSFNDRWFIKRKYD